MVGVVTHRPFRRWIYALVAAQAFVSAPMASAFAAIAYAGQESDCAEMMHASASEGRDACPCCPEGEYGIAGCLSACTASLGAVVVFAFEPPASLPARVDQGPVLQRAQAAEPPLDPPPIY